MEESRPRVTGRREGAGLQTRSWGPSCARPGDVRAEPVLPLPLRFSKGLPRTRACPWKAETAAGTVSLRRGVGLAAMSGGFELQPRDGGPRVALAPGETVIGRGPLLGVSVAGGLCWTRRAVLGPRCFSKPYSPFLASPLLRPCMSGF